MGAQLTITGLFEKAARGSILTEVEARRLVWYYVLRTAQGSDLDQVFGDSVVLACSSDAEKVLSRAQAHVAAKVAQLAATNK